MQDAESTEFSAMCQDANRIAARLRGETYVKPKAINPMKRQLLPKPPIVPLRRNRAITEQQQRVLDFMRRFLAENDQMPSYCVIAKEFGWKSQASGQGAVMALAQKGYLERNAVGGWRFPRKEQSE